MITVPRSRSSKGFTLIELLVVIAIIAILAAILFPVFSKAREKARMIKCTSNQRQIAQAALLWAQENDEKLPQGATFFTDINVPAAVLKCPTAGREVSLAFVYNAWVAGKALAQAKDSSTTILVGDGKTTGIGSTLTISGQTYTKEQKLGYGAEDYIARHTKRYLCAYLDGHVDVTGSVVSSAGYDTMWTNSTAGIVIGTTAGRNQVGKPAGAASSWEGSCSYQTFVGDCAVRFRTGDPWTKYSVGLAEATEANRTSTASSSVTYRVYAYGNTAWLVYAGSTRLIPGDLYNGGAEWTVQRKGSTMEYWVNENPTDPNPARNRYYLYASTPVSPDTPLMSKAMCYDKADLNTWAPATIDYFQLFDSAVL